ncbi:MAG: hypothetical protein SGJ18_16485 [Pseudomonadota bacterium]|nr:hypothetical protein [Pseudomonadota bacterium]
MFLERIIFVAAVTFSVFSISAAEKIGDRLNCPNVIDISDFRDQTFLSFMISTVRPQLNKLATNGYPVAGSEVVKEVLRNVSEKVKMKALRGAGDDNRLVELAESLKGETATLYTMPGKIAAVDKKFDRYGLSTFLGLASCGGAVIKLYDDNYAYNIHYGSGKVQKDPQTGRSFGAGPARPADDASDKAYLTDLEKYVTSGSNISEFFETLIQALTNSDTSNYKSLNAHGQTLLTDFLAVYTAEQARNLMDEKISLHWDAALLEVTLLSAFHSGQRDVMLFFKDPASKSTYFTESVYNQAPGGEKRDKKRKAKLIDYWQFSSRSEPQYKNRSGINVTKEQFRELGLAISDFERKNNPDLVKRVEKHFAGVKTGENLFEELSQFLINSRTPKKLGKVGYDLAQDFTAFLKQAARDAEEITSLLKKKHPKLL